MTATDDPRTIAPVDPWPSVPTATSPARSAPAGGDRPPDPDWTHLLSPAGPGRVAVVGPSTPAARAAVLAGTVAPVDGPADTVVLTSTGRGDVALALRLLAPRGVVHVGGIGRRRRARLRRRLRAAGLEVTTWWHRPSIEAARCLIGLDHRVAAATVVRTVADRGRWAGLEAALARTGLPRILSSEVTLLARAPGPTPLVAPLCAPDARTPVAGLVTPRFAMSRAVVGVATDPEGRRLDSVVKAARRPDDDHLIRAEAAHLCDLLDRTGPFPGAPSRPHVEARGGRIVLVEDAVPGLPLDRRSVRRDPAGALRAGRCWIEALPRGPRSRPVDDGRSEALLERAIATIASRPGPRSDERADLAARAEVLLAPLTAAELPVVFEHGDLSHPNVMVDRDGAFGVVDWERSRADGLPLHDLTLFATYVVESVLRPAGPSDLAAEAGVALGPGGWAWPEVALHAEHLDIDRRLVEPLMLACWTRRLADRPAPGPTPHRDEVLWAATITDLEDRR